MVVGMTEETQMCVKLGQQKQGIDRGQAIIEPYSITTRESYIKKNKNKIMAENGKNYFVNRFMQNIIERK